MKFQLLPQHKAIVRSRFISTFCICILLYIYFLSWPLGRVQRFFAFSSLKNCGAFWRRTIFDFVFKFPLCLHFFVYIFLLSWPLRRVSALFAFSLFAFSSLKTAGLLKSEHFNLCIFYSRFFSTLFFFFAVPLGGSFISIPQNCGAFGGGTISTCVFPAFLRLFFLFLFFAVLLGGLLFYPTSMLCALQYCATLRCTSTGNL